MAKSILIIKYKIPLSIGEIFKKLNKKKFKIEYVDKNNEDKKITLEQEISNLKIKEFGVEGYIKYYYQKENEFKGDGTFDKTSKEFTFLFVPQSNLVILHGNTEFRIRIMDFFGTILHNGDNLFESITIEKEKLRKLIEKIFDMKPGENNLEEARFFHNDQPLGKLKRLSFTTIPSFCATKHDLFTTHYNNCTHWNCVLRVYKCNGLLDTAEDKGYLLRINRDASVSFSTDRNLTEWNRFVIETMKPILKF